MSVDESEAELSEESDVEEPEPEPVKKVKKVEKSATGADVLEGYPRKGDFLHVLCQCTVAIVTPLKDMCEPYGTVKKVNIVRNAAGGSKGLAFVEYADKLEAEKCVLNTMSLQIDGRNIFARISLPQTDINSMKKQKEAELKVLSLKVLNP